MDQQKRFLWRRIDENKKKLIAAALIKGGAIKQVAIDFGVSYHAVWKIAHEYLILEKHFAWKPKYKPKDLV